MSEKVGFHPIAPLPNLAQISKRWESPAEDDKE